LTSCEVTEVERYLAELLLDFKVGNPFKWWALNLKSYPLLSSVAKKYLSAPPTSVASEGFSLVLELYMMIEEVEFLQSLLKSFY